MKTRYFKVTGAAQRGKIHGEEMVETILDVQELHVRRLEGTVPHCYDVRPIGERMRTMDTLPLYYIDLHEETCDGLGKSIGERLINSAFSHFLLGGFIERFRKAITG